MNGDETRRNWQAGQDLLNDMFGGGTALAGLVERPQGKPVLVTEDNKRPEINTAQNDFNE